jgi:hypothetical protein
MRLFSTDRKILAPLLAVFAVFIASRLAFDRVGLRYQGDAFIGSWQAIDPEMLRTDLWRSVYYLHSQPPLMNLAYGLVLRAFPDRHEQVFHLLYYCFGLGLSAVLFSLGRSAGIRPWISAALTAWFMTSPATVLYEHLLSYAYPLPVMLALAGVFLHRFSASKKYRWGFLFFSMLTLTVLTWSLFHLAWLLFIILLMWLIDPPARKRLLLAALVPLLVAVGWYAKNLLHFDEFTASSWAGMNLSRITTFRLAEEEREALVRAGSLSGFALIPPFRNPLVYLRYLPHTPLTGIPLLDEPEISLGGRNHHHLVYIEASGRYLEDALMTIRSRPRVYLRAVLQAAYIYFHSASDYEFVSENRSRIGSLDLWWNRVFYGQWAGDETASERLGNLSPGHVAWWLVLVFLTTLAGAAACLWKRRGHLADPVNTVVLFMAYTILYVTLVGTSMDIGENNRFRFAIDPLLMVLFVFVLREEALPGLVRQKPGNQTEGKREALHGQLT